jgi:hypothetical protein
MSKKRVLGVVREVPFGSPPGSDSAINALASTSRALRSCAISPVEFARAAAATGRFQCAMTTSLAMADCSRICPGDHAGGCRAILVAEGHRPPGLRLGVEFWRRPRAACPKRGSASVL